MQIDDIETRLSVSRYREVKVAVDPSLEFPGYVRSVYLRPPARVHVEFEEHGMDEGGAYFEANYATLGEAVAAVESFLAKPLSEWRDHNQTGDYPLADTERLELGHQSLAEAIARRSVPLPGGASFSLRGSSYWKQFES